MHICFLTHEYPREDQTQGGIGSVVQTLAHALIQNGHKVSVVGVRNDLDYDIYEKDNGVEIYRLAGSPWKFANFIPNAKKLNKKLYEIDAKNSIDIIEGSELSFAFITHKFPAKKVIRMHGGHHFFAVTLGKKPALWRSIQEKLSFSKADALIAVSHFVGNTTKELLDLTKPFEVIYNIIDTSKFHEAKRDKVIHNRIVFVGTVTEKKGVRQLVQAMPKITQALPDATLQIVGRDWIDPNTGESYTEYLKTFIPDNIAKSIEIVGAVPHSQIPDILEKANVCVYPSHMEAMPIAWLEGLGMAKPVVASELGPGKEAVIDKKTGLLCNPLDPDDIADKVIYMLTHQDEAFTMGKNAREDILNRFDTSKIIKQNMDFYRNVL
jgi:glycosyltransferase involved in cell wall biosynthesis